MKSRLVSSLSGSSIVYERRAVSQIRTYNWPPLQLNFWIFVMLLSASSIVGVFSSFIQIQTQLDLPIPWYFPYFKILRHPLHVRAVGARGTIIRRLGVLGPSNY
ncbi:hypothetical protein J3458_018945 [Metarhizium acridum]|uniref:uncharacterized protein n=1 Tax=Metarhizium acridum TaxID=92637 RepID=UPI001C6AC3E2|nr:hypothetical protein J3458_018945 [Metarhizium acridum]